MMYTIAGLGSVALTLALYVGLPAGILKLLGY